MATRTININAAANISQVPRSWVWSVLAALNQIKTWATEVDGDLDEINDYIDKEFERDGVVGGGFALSIGSAVSTDLKINGSIRYRIGGREYVSDADLEVTLATGEITQNLWGAWAIEIDKKGVLTTKRANASTMAFANEQDALLSLASIGRTAGAIDVAYLTIDAATNGFTPGTDDPNSSDAQADNHGYRVVAMPRIDNGLIAAMGSGFVTGTTPEEYAYGTQDIRVNGLEPAQIALDATRAFDDADTIGNTQFGGWLLVSDLAGTAVYALGSDGIAGTVTVMTHATAAAANTQLDVIMARLPSVFVILSRLVITNNLGGTWTAATDDLNGTDGTAVFTDRSSGTHDRLLSSEDDSLVDSPAVPATVAAAVADDFTTRELGTPS